MGRDSNLVLGAQRRLARSILIGLVAAIVSFVLFASGPNLAFSVAMQQTTTPPPSSPATNYRIEFLNPSGYSEEISAKDDGSNTTYHLVAWVNALPENAGVVFSYRDDEGNEQEIGAATQTPTPDTFELYWEIPADLGDRNPSSPSGAFTLIAHLYSGQTELDRDTENDLTLNNSSPDPTDPNPGDEETENQGETVEITYPSNGGPWGLYQPRDGRASGVIEVTTSASLNRVRSYFTASAPGSEPIWRECSLDPNALERKADTANGVRCRLPLGQDPLEVTAVAILAIDQPVPQTTNNDSGDAHRAVPYMQTPTSIVVDPATQASTTGQCSGVITATVSDQNGVRITTANIDVHAAGPTDELYFDDGSNASANQPPENDHPRETARECSDPAEPTNSGVQGEHEDTAGNDRKHVESTSGTDDDGQWTFQLSSAAAGATQYTAWVDQDADDVFCSAEVNASGAIGWSEGAPAVTGVLPETSDCPSPQPSSPNPGPTTPGPDPTDSPSPDPRDCTKFGTDGADQIDGTEGDDVICAYGGDDIIRGLGGDDVIYADNGNDDVRGGGGGDRIYGGAGEDTLRGNAAADRIYGQADQDTISGGGGKDFVNGAGGSDTVRGSGGNDKLIGRGGFDILTGEAGDDLLKGGPARDVLRGGRGTDRCRGGGDRDQLKGCERRS